MKKKDGRIMAELTSTATFSFNAVVGMDSFEFLEKDLQILVAKSFTIEQTVKISLRYLASF